MPRVDSLSVRGDYKEDKVIPWDNKLTLTPGEWEVRTYSRYYVRTSGSTSEIGLRTKVGETIVCEEIRTGGSSGDGRGFASFGVVRVSAPTPISFFCRTGASGVVAIYEGQVTATKISD